MRRLIALAIALSSLGLCAQASAQTTVSTVPQLRSEIDAAQPGDVIELQPGNYDVGGKISVTAGGTEDRPITLRAASLGEATLRMDTLEGFLVNAPHWRFENLDLVGVCSNDSDCEHAFHIVGRGDGTTISTAGCAISTPRSRGTAPSTARVAGGSGPTTWSSKGANSSTRRPGRPPIR